MSRSRVSDAAPPTGPSAVPWRWMDGAGAAAPAIVTYSVDGPTPVIDPPTRPGTDQEPGTQSPPAHPAG